MNPDYAFDVSVPPGRGGGARGLLGAAVVAGVFAAALAFVMRPAPPRVIVAVSLPRGATLEVNGEPATPAPRPVTAPVGLPQPVVWFFPRLPPGSHEFVAHDAAGARASLRLLVQANTRPPVVTWADGALVAR